MSRCAVIPGHGDSESVCVSVRTCAGVSVSVWLDCVCRIHWLSAKATLYGLFRFKRAGFTTHSYKCVCGGGGDGGFGGAMFTKCSGKVCWVFGNVLGHGCSRETSRLLLDCRYGRLTSPLPISCVPGPSSVTRSPHRSGCVFCFSQKHFCSVPSCNSLNGFKALRCLTTTVPG